MFSSIQLKQTVTSNESKTNFVELVCCNSDSSWNHQLDNPHRVGSSQKARAGDLSIIW